MKLFCNLLTDCLNEPKTSRKTELLQIYFQNESTENLPIALHLLIGKNFGRFCSGKVLREWCSEKLSLPLWLVDETYESLGDNSETIALCYSKNIASKSWDLYELCATMLLLKNADINEKKQWIIDCWTHLPSNEIYVFNKLLGGGIRIGASKKIVLKALSKAVSVSHETLEQRLLGNWIPTVDCYESLINPNDSSEKGLQPYPFFLASPIPDPITKTIQSINEWLIEPKWDGIRAQIIHRNDEVAIWSRGNELISHQFPDLLAAGTSLPNGVFDGEILAWDNESNAPFPFYELQKRLNRKNVSKSMLKDIPCKMKIYDVIEYNGDDIRNQSLTDRREKLNAFKDPFFLSESLNFDKISQLQRYVDEARNNNIEGVILKRKDSSYQQGRVRGDWWKLKVSPMTLDAVIMYAQKGKGIRSGLFTDYTFGVWNGSDLTPIGKAYSGLTNEEIKEVNKIIKKNLTDKFGPVRGVSPCIVLEISFDDIHPSSRHKSGIALRFPRIHRLRLDKPIHEANTLEDAQNLCK